jgi:quinoprotein dehydrogenase-associated probable ABC transporter substrate-binding protein
MSSRSSGRPDLGGSSRRSEVAALVVPALVLAMAVTSPVRPTPPMHAEPLMTLAVEPVLRVCADPNNLPFSNRAGHGFENEIAALLAHSIGERLVYSWWPERRGFVGHTVDAGICDVVIGVPTGYPQLLTTRPYYRSTYVFVSRADRALHLRSLDDARLHQLRIGLHFTGGRSNPPPADALARRGVITNVVAYSIYGDYRTPNPPARLIDAVAAGDVDLAIVWGPLAGYFATREPVGLDVVPVSPAVDLFAGAAPTPFTFDIALGVRHGDIRRRDQLQRALDRDAPTIRRILDEYHVPLVADIARSTDPPSHTLPGPRVAGEAE